MTHSYPLAGGPTRPQQALAGASSVTTLIGAQVMRPTTVLACAPHMKKTRPSL